MHVQRTIVGRLHRHDELSRSTGGSSEAVGAIVTRQNPLKRATLTAVRAAVVAVVPIRAPGASEAAPVAAATPRKLRRFGWKILSLWSLVIGVTVHFFNRGRSVGRLMRSSVCLTHVRGRAGRSRSADLRERRHGGGNQRDARQPGRQSSVILWQVSFAARAARRIGAIVLILVKAGARARPVQQIQRSDAADEIRNYFWTCIR